MRIDLEECVIRSLVGTDAESIARYANNRKIWLNLRDLFPHPYTLADARDFIQTIQSAEHENCYTIEVDGTASGVIGFGLHKDVDRVAAEIGYWLAEPLWGRGIMTAALRATTLYGMQTFGLTRVFALPYEWNPASFRVLEKAGYVREGYLRRSVIKDGKVIDQMLYAFVDED